MPDSQGWHGVGVATLCLEQRCPCYMMLSTTNHITQQSRKLAAALRAMPGRMGWPGAMHPHSAPASAASAAFQAPRCLPAPCSRAPDAPTHTDAGPARWRHACRECRAVRCCLWVHPQMGNSRAQKHTGIPSPGNTVGHRNRIFHCQASTLSQEGCGHVSGIAQQRHAATPPHLAGVRLPEVCKQPGWSVGFMKATLCGRCRFGQSVSATHAPT